MRTAFKYAAALAVTGALALAAATPSQARWHGGGAAAAGFAAGALVGAAAASANNGYYYAPGYSGYAYEPGYAYDPGIQADHRYGGRSGGYYYYNNEQQCSLGSGNPNYVPCNNQ
jgi:hypothetical protein